MHILCLEDGFHVKRFPDRDRLVDTRVFIHIIYLLCMPLFIIFIILSYFLFHLLKGILKTKKIRSLFLGGKKYAHFNVILMHLVMAEKNLPENTN